MMVDKQDSRVELVLTRRRDGQIETSEGLVHFRYACLPKPVIIEARRKDRTKSWSAV